MADLPKGALPVTVGGVVNALGRTPSDAEAASGRAASERMTPLMLSEGRKMFGRSLPEMVSLLSTLALPEKAIAGWAARPLLAAATAAATDPIGQTIAGEQPTIQHAQDRALFAGGAQSGGELFSGLLKRLGTGMALDAVGAGKVARKELPNIDDVIMRERIPVGAPGTGSGTAEVVKRAEANAREMARVIAAAGPQGRVPGTPARPATSTTTTSAGAAQPSAPQMAHMLNREREALAAVEVAARAHGMDPKDLLALISNPVPNLADLAAASSRYGLQPKTVAELQQFIPTLRAAAGARAAVAAPTQVPVTTTTPAVKATPARPARPGTVHATDDLLAGVDAEIANLRKSAHPEDLVEADALQARRDAFAAQNPNGVPTEALDSAVRSSQRRAQGTYTKDVNGKPVTVQTTPDEQIFHRLFARQGRAELRKVPGVAATKDRARELIALEKVYKNAEATPPPPLAELGDPTRTIPTAARRTVTRRDVGSRIGFGLTEPRVLFAARRTPQAGNFLFRAFSPDDTRR